MLTQALDNTIDCGVYRISEIRWGKLCLALMKEVLRKQINSRAKSLVQDNREKDEKNIVVRLSIRMA